MKQVVARIIEVLFRRDTEYAELLLGVLSFLTGVWLFLPYCHSAFCPGWGLDAQPELWGGLLLFTGSTKLIGVFWRLCNLRKLSCMLATIVWLFLATSFMQLPNPALCVIAAPLCFVLGVFNGLIYTKLHLVVQKWKNC